jgi:hypothetical protein
MDSSKDTERRRQAMLMLEALAPGERDYERGITYSAADVRKRIHARLAKLEAGE